MSLLPFQKAGLLVAADEVQVIAPAQNALITRFAPTVLDPPVGASLVLRVQDVTGASPTGYIEATIVAGDYVAAPVTGSFAVLAGSTIFVRVVSGPTGGNAASWLGGYFETSIADVTGAFCTLGQLKSFAGVTVATWDSDLSLIISTVTGAMQRYMARDILSTAYTVERHTMNISHTRLVLDQGPIISVEEVRVDGNVVAPADYVVISSERTLYNSSGWATGTYHIEVDYTAGYASTPTAIIGAALNQCRAQWKLHPAGGDLFGKSQRAEGGGGSSAFVVDAWYPGVENVLKTYRRLA